MLLGGQKITSQRNNVPSVSLTWGVTAVATLYAKGGIKASQANLVKAED